MSRQSVREQLRRELARGQEHIANDEPLRAARVAMDTIQDLNDFEAQFSELRRAAFRMMEEAYGWSHGDIVLEFKGRITRQRVGQIVNG